MEEIHINERVGEQSHVDWVRENAGTWANNFGPTITEAFGTISDPGVRSFNVALMRTTAISLSIYSRSRDQDGFTAADWLAVSVGTGLSAIASGFVAGALAGARLPGSGPVKVFFIGVGGVIGAVAGEEAVDDLFRTNLGLEFD
ncbi:hypothetical protein [Rhodophyticola sp.]|jgi:hypothetical protein|uniref:hypothetical protein n=1 Tax=Rhodophyticola sp. TaxID=2680032 RepID=UPI003D2E81BE